MRTSRLEAFSDGVLAIIITVMVLELKVPAGHGFLDLFRTSGFGLLTYLLSFVYVGIYWNNHHHMFSLVRQVSGGVLWMNLALLFCLSLFPFTTAWMGENHFASWPTAVYGIVMLCAAIAYYILQTTIIRAQGAGSKLARAIGADRKGKLSPLLYAAAVPLAFVNESLADAIYIGVALIWLVPDSRIERQSAK